MATELKTRIVLRNDSTANWTAQDPVLMKGEIGFDMDLLIFKVRFFRLKSPTVSAINSPSRIPVQ